MATTTPARLPGSAPGVAGYRSSASPRFERRRGPRSDGCQSVQRTTGPSAPDKGFDGPTDPARCYDGRGDRDEPSPWPLPADRGAAAPAGRRARARRRARSRRAPPRSTGRPSSPRTCDELLAAQDILALPFPERARRARRRSPDRLPRDRADQPRLRDHRADPRRPGARRTAAPRWPARDEQQARWFPRLAAGEDADRVRPDRGRGRLRCRRDPHRGPSATATTTSSRHQALHQPRVRGRPRSRSSP